VATAMNECSFIRGAVVKRHLDGQRAPPVTAECRSSRRTRISSHVIDPHHSGTTGRRIVSNATCRFPEASMLDESQQHSLVTRLNRIEGQIRGIRRMVQEPRLCIDILQQLAAAEAALNRISLAVLKFHVETCVPDGISKGEPEQSRRLAELVDIFDRFAK
jgi:DNA-binding FrmR family transcriptional regulator